MVNKTDPEKPELKNQGQIPEKASRFMQWNITPLSIIIIIRSVKTDLQLPPRAPQQLHNIVLSTVQHNTEHSTTQY